MRALLSAVLILLVAPGAAGAAVPAGDYGGGAVTSGAFATGSSWMWARVGADGRARVGGAVKVACGLVRFDAMVTPAADGTFAFRRVRRTRVGGARLRAVANVEGRFESGVAYGTVYGRLRNRRPDGRVRLCTTRARRPWKLNTTVPVTGPGAPHPTTAYLGLTSQPGDVPRPFLLGIGADTTRVATAAFEYTRRCRRRSYFLNDVTPGAPIRPDGTFSIRERFTLRYVDVQQNERFRVSLDGQFAAGAVTGTLRVTSVARRRGTRRVVDRCDTGPLTFAARP